MKRSILIFFLILTMTVFTACNNKKDIQEMDIQDKLRYAWRLDFDIYIYMDGQWTQGVDYYWLRELLDPDSEYFEDFYTDVRFAHHSDEVGYFWQTEIFAFLREDSATHTINVLNWEVDSANLDLQEFGLTYPISVDDLLNNYEEIDRLIEHDSWFGVSLVAFTRDYNTRIEFELDRLNEWDKENTEKIIIILDRLGMTQDEVAPIIRASGSVDAFVAVSDLMLEEGLSAEEALEQVGRRRRK